MKTLLKTASLLLVMSFIFSALVSCNLVSRELLAGAVEDNDGTSNGHVADNFVMPEGGYDGSAVTIRFYHQMSLALIW